MKHSKRKRTRFLLMAMLGKRGYVIQVMPAKPEDRDERKSPTIKIWCQMPDRNYARVAVRESDGL